jgi:hypothetical protein
LDEVKTDRGLLIDQEPRELNGVKFKFGAGGFHSIPAPRVYDQPIYDYDFASLYPNLCITMGIGGTKFTTILKDLLSTRMKYKKSGQKTKSDAYKLLINAITGCFFDPYATDSVFSPASSLTMLCAGQFQMLDLITRLPKNTVILSNTDSIFCTQPLPEGFIEDVFNRTGLQLECEVYDKLLVKDVNSVCAIRNGKIVKRKKEFIELGSIGHNIKAPVIMKCVVNLLMYGISIESTFNECLEDGSNFFYFTKGKATTKLYLDGALLPDQKIRYYVGLEGKELTRVGVNTSRVHAGHVVKMCMNTSDFDSSNVDKDYYYDEIKNFLGRM